MVEEHSIDGILITEGQTLTMIVKVIMENLVQMLVVIFIIIKCIFKLLANKVPEDETGGGLRVKELRTVDGASTYKAQYDYSHPTANRSSGITSYAPVDGLKYVPYQTEIPGPAVMYEYVTMKETSNSGEYYSKTRYRHHVSKTCI